MAEYGRRVLLSIEKALQDSARQASCVSVRYGSARNGKAGMSCRGKVGTGEFRHGKKFL